MPKAGSPMDVNDFLLDIRYHLEYRLIIMENGGKNAFQKKWRELHKCL